jgi:hypothetical protein
MSMSAAAACNMDRQLRAQSIHRLLEQRRREQRTQSCSVVSASVLRSSYPSKIVAPMRSFSVEQEKETEQSPCVMDVTDKRFHWRNNPLDSQSDWILEVRAIDGPTTSDDGYANDFSLGTDSDDDNHSLCPVELYHIHKAVIMVQGSSSRKSQYLAQVFATSSKSSCDIHLPPLAASVVPCLLDYMYGASLVISTQSATSLYYLGNFFRIKDLQQRAMEFCRKDLSLQNAHLYYKHAKRLEEPDIIQATAQYVGRKIRAINWNVPLVDECRASFWKHVLPYCTCRRRASLFVAITCARDYCEKNLDAKLFRQLTRQVWMPDIDSRVACTFLRVEAELSGQSNFSASAAQLSHVETKIEELTCLQRRCFASLARDWNKLTPDILQYLTHNVPVKLLELLMKELDRASAGQSIEIRKERNWSGISPIDDMNVMLLGEGKYEV